MAGPPQHGIDGWVLEDMEWDPDTGIAVFQYSSVSGGLPCQHIRMQPTREGHANWELLRGLEPAVLAL